MSSPMADLMLPSMGFDLLPEGFGDDRVIDLGALGPTIELTISGDGVFAFGGAVPEASTWTMLLFSFAAIGIAGRRRRAAPESS